MKAVEIPQRVDEPPHVLLWSADELAPMLVGLMVGVLVGQLLLCCLLGLMVTKGYRRYRDNRPDGYLFHLLWRSGFWPCRARSWRNPYVRRYFE